LNSENDGLAGNLRAKRQENTKEQGQRAARIEERPHDGFDDYLQKPDAQKNKSTFNQYRVSRNFASAPNPPEQVFQVVRLRFHLKRVCACRMASKRKAKARVVWDQTEEGRSEKIIII
jgi:hypothetical protein